MRRYVTFATAAFLAACGGSDGDGTTLGGSEGGTSSVGGNTTAGTGGKAGSTTGGAAGTPSAGGAGASAGTGATGGTTAGKGGSAGTSGGAAGAGQSGSAGSAGAGGANAGAAGAGGAGMAGSAGAAGTSAGAAGTSAGAAGTSAAGNGGSGGGAGGSSPTDPPTITAGAANHILLLGTVVTPEVTLDGAVLVVDDKIACVDTLAVCQALPAAADATVIVTHGVIAPGMIDTHNHILFDIFDGDDWLPMKTYQDHSMWTAEARYGVMLDVKQCLEDASQGKPTWCPAKYDGTGNIKCEMDKWGEMKGMVAGTTSIVGLPGTSSACFGSLSRSIDVAQNDLGVDLVQTSATFPPSSSSITSLCANFTSAKTNAYLIHVGEGVPGSTAGKEFATLGGLGTPAGCAYAPQTAITHGVAFGDSEFATMKMHGMKLTWSPASNVALYGVTADIPKALAAGITISLAPDWSMGGSQNLLDEMRFADAWDDAHFGNVLTPKDILLMTTSSAAAVVGYADRIGHLQTGYMADLFVVPGDGTAPYDQILAAHASDVRLVMVGGRVLYGDAVLKVAGPAAPGCEDLDVCTASKFICVAETPAGSKLEQTFAQVKQVLEDAMTDVDAITDPAKGTYTFAPIAPLTTCN